MEIRVEGTFFAKFPADGLHQAAGIFRKVCGHILDAFLDIWGEPVIKYLEVLPNLFKIFLPVGINLRQVGNQVPCLQHNARDRQIAKAYNGSQHADDNDHGTVLADDFHFFL